MQHVHSSTEAEADPTAGAAQSGYAGAAPVPTAPVVNPWRVINTVSGFNRRMKRLGAAMVELREDSSTAVADAWSAVDDRWAVSDRMERTRQDLASSSLADGYNRRAESLNASIGQRVSTFAESNRLADLTQRVVEKSEAAWKKAYDSLNKTVTNCVDLRTMFAPCDDLSICYYECDQHPGVMGLVALTIDDAICSQADTSRSMVDEVRQLLAEFSAHATFFLCTNYVVGHEEGVCSLLSDGHEIANHCPEDRAYGGDTEAEFEGALMESEGCCQHLRDRAHLMDKSGECAASCDSTSSSSTSTGNPMAGTPEATAKADSLGTTAEVKASEVLPGVALKSALNPAAAKAALNPRWFRAPHADLSDSMRTVLKRHGFANVLCDCFANDTLISDSHFIAQKLLSTVTSGSILVIHMPERGFREHNFLALRELLQGLQQRSLRPVTVSELNRAASSS